MSAVSKVIFGNQTLIDISQDTVRADKLLKNFTAHGADGEPVVGTYEPGSEVNVEPNKNATPYTTAQVVTPDSGYDALGQVTVSAIKKLEEENAAGGITVTIGDVAP